MHMTPKLRAAALTLAAFTTAASAAPTANSSAPSLGDAVVVKAGTIHLVEVGETIRGGGAVLVEDGKYARDLIGLEAYGASTPRYAAAQSASERPTTRRVEVPLVSTSQELSLASRRSSKSLSDARRRFRALWALQWALLRALRRALPRALLLCSGTVVSYQFGRCRQVGVVLTLGWDGNNLSGWGPGRECSAITCLRARSHIKCQ